MGVCLVGMLRYVIVEPVMRHSKVQVTVFNINITLGHAGFRRFINQYEQNFGSLIPKSVPIQPNRLDNSPGESRSISYVITSIFHYSQHMRLLYPPPLCMVGIRDFMDYSFFIKHIIFPRQHFLNTAWMNWPEAKRCNIVVLPGYIYIN